MYYILFTYFLITILYFFIIKMIEQIYELIYQNSSSKNRNYVDTIRQKIIRRSRFYIVVIWPIYEIYLYLRK